jgi:hypothetical protein
MTLSGERSPQPFVGRLWTSSAVIPASGLQGQSADLKSRWAAEEKSLAAWKPAPGMSKYGGWKPGSQAAKGFFYAKKVDKRWWLVDPDGALFFSMGMDCVRVNGVTRQPR